MEHKVHKINPLDAIILQEHGIIEKARITPHQNEIISCFSKVESVAGTGKQRRRMIMWPEAFNTETSTRDNTVNLFHVSHYLNQVHKEQYQ